MSIHSKIYLELLEGIQSGRYPVGTALPSLRALSREYTISQETVRIALNRLREEGRIISAHGRGNFVAPEPLRIRDIMIIGPLSGHLYDEYLATFARVFSNRKDLRLVMEDIVFYDDKEITDAFRQRNINLKHKIDNALKNNTLDAIFFNGESRFTLSFLAEYIGKVKLFCYADQAQLTDVPSPSVSVDYFHGGYIGIRHLAEAGCRHIIISTFHTQQGVTYSHKGVTFLKGCRQAADELAVKLTVKEYSVSGNSGECDELIKFIEDHPEVDGIFALGDFRMLKLYPELKKRNRIPGSDIALLGFYNTPWCEAFDPPLSSINTFPVKLIEDVAAMYFAEEGILDFAQKIPPELVVRASSRLIKSKCKGDTLK